MNRTKIKARIYNVEISAEITLNEDAYLGIGNIDPNGVFLEHKINSIPGRFINGLILSGQIEVPEDPDYPFLDEKALAVVRHNYEQSGWEQKAKELGLNRIEISIDGDFVHEGVIYYSIIVDSESDI